MSVPSSLAQGVFAITGDDRSKLTTPATGGIKVTTAGTIKYECADGSVIVQTLAAGEREPVSIVKVFATTDGSTAITATGIFGYKL